MKIIYSITPHRQVRKKGYLNRFYTHPHPHTPTHTHPHPSCNFYCWWKISENRFRSRYLLTEMSKMQQYYLTYPSWSINMPITSYNVKTPSWTKMFKSFISVLGVTKVGQWVSIIEFIIYITYWVKQKVSFFFLTWCLDCKWLFYIYNPCF